MPARPRRRTWRSCSAPASSTCGRSPQAGWTSSAAAKQIAFSVSIGCRFYQAIAKIRAARMLWAQVVASCGGDAAAQTMRLRVTTSRRVLTTRSPAINILRNTAACYAGAIAGADAITTVPFDAPVVLSTESSRRHCAEHPAHPRRGMPSEPRHRSRRRVLVHRVVYPAARREGLGAVPADRGARRHAGRRERAAGSPSRSTSAS